MKNQLLYEGKAKKIYSVVEANNQCIAYFKDDLTAFNAQKKGQEEGKGTLNCKITTEIFELLKKNGIKTHLIKKISDNELLVQKVKIIPIEVVVRNVATGSIIKRLGLQDGLVFDFPLVEFFYKEDTLNDPIVIDDHCLLMRLAESQKQLDYLKSQARKINEILKTFFESKNLRLIDFKIEFGVNEAGEIILADEISPDSCRFWDENSGEKLDKDRFREGLGNVKIAYTEVLKRILS